MNIRIKSLLDSTINYFIPVESYSPERGATVIPFFASLGMATAGIVSVLEIGFGVEYAVSSARIFLLKVIIFQILIAYPLFILTRRVDIYRGVSGVSLIAILSQLRFVDYPFMALNSAASSFFEEFGYLWFYMAAKTDGFWALMGCFGLGFIVVIIIIMLLWGVIRFYAFSPRAPIIDVGIYNSNFHSSILYSLDLMFTKWIPNTWRLWAIYGVYVIYLGPVYDYYSLYNAIWINHLILGMYLTIKLLSLNFNLFLAAMWSCGGVIIIYWFKGFKSSLQLAEYFHHVSDSTGEGSNFRFKLFAPVAILVSVLPLLWAFDISVIGEARAFYLSNLVELQWFIMLSWPIFAFLFLSFVFLQDSESLITQLIFYFSTTISVFFINLCAASSCEAAQRLATGDFSKKPLFFMFDGLGPLSDLSIFGITAQSVVMGFDYMALMLCTMTALVFSFVYFISLYNDKIRYKSLFFMLLLVVEFCVLMSFLSLNLLSFFVFFESSLLPMAIIIGIWGSSTRRWFAARMMLYYSLVASTPFMVAIVYLYTIFGSVDYILIADNLHLLSSSEKLFIFISLLLIFAVKIPLFPFHSWLLVAHVDAPTSGSIILAAVMLKVGLYGIIRFVLGLFHSLAVYYAPAVLALALIGVFYSAVMSIGETDTKKLIALTSVSHMNFAVIGLFIFEQNGFYGAIYMMIGHAIVTSGLFYLVGLLYDRFHTRSIMALGGLAGVMPLFSSALFFFVFANAAFPCSLNFLAELFILTGVIHKMSLLAFFILVISFVALMYSNIKMFIHICFGSIGPNSIGAASYDFTHNELVVVMLLIANCIILMVFNHHYFFPLFADEMARYIY